VVGILVLVDEQELEAFGQLAADRRITLQEQGGFHQKIIEIQPVAVGQQLLIARVDLRERPREEVRRSCLECISIDQLVLQRGYGVEHARRGKVGAVQTAVLESLLDASALVGGVVDAEIGMDSRGSGIAAQDSHAQRMERADMGPGRGAECNGPLAHLFSRLIGEGNRTNVVGSYARLNEGGDPIGDDPRLAAAGAGQHEERTFAMNDSLSL
jgi:hypothetical protein